MDQLIWRLRSLLEKQSTCPPVFWEHRIGRYVKILLEYLKSHGLYDGDAERIAVVTRLSDFHDVGKSRVPLEMIYTGECGDFPLELCKALKEATEIFQIA